MEAEENAFKAWQSKVPPYEQVKGGMTKDELFRWSTDLPEYETWHKAFKEMANYWKSSASPGGKPLPSNPPVGLSADEWAAINKAADGSSKAPPSPGASAGAKQTTPPDPNAPTLPGTGPHGTQIIPPGPKCPGPACPPTPVQKTQTGLGGVANALGQKIGG